MLVEGNKIEGIVRRILVNHEGEQIGLIVDIPGLAFIPKSLLPDQHGKNSLEQLVGKCFEGIIYRVDRVRNCAIIQPTSFDRCIVIRNHSPALATNAATKMGRDRLP